MGRPTRSGVQLRGSRDHHGYTGPFYENIESYVEAEGQRVPGLPLPHVTCWILDVAVDSQPTRLHIYREDLDEEEPAVCDHCRIIGWQHHPVCNARYHVVVPAVAGEDSLQDAASLPAIAECCLRGDGAGAPARLASGGKGGEAPAPYMAPESPLDARSHLLHGLLHGNGCGHLLRINGREGGSPVLSGRQLMDLWDALCCALGTSLVSVEDVSNKGGVELRIVHTAAHTGTWYGRWGYGFGRGGFGLKQAAWRRATAAIGSAPLAHVVADLRDAGQSPAAALVDAYQALPGPGPQPTSLGPLFKRLLQMLAVAAHAATAADNAPAKEPIAPGPSGTKPLRAAKPACGKPANVSAFGAGPRLASPGPAPARPAPAGCKVEPAARGRYGRTTDAEKATLRGAYAAATHGCESEGPPPKRCRTGHAGAGVAAPPPAGQAMQPQPLGNAGRRQSALSMQPCSPAEGDMRDEANNPPSSGTSAQTHAASAEGSFADWREEPAAIAADDTAAPGSALAAPGVPGLPLAGVGRGPAVREQLAALRGALPERWYLKRWGRCAAARALDALLMLPQGEWITWSDARLRLRPACPDNSLLEFLPRATAGCCIAGLAMLREEDREGKTAYVRLEPLGHDDSCAGAGSEQAQQEATELTSGTEPATCGKRMDGQLPEQRWRSCAGAAVAQSPADAMAGLELLDAPTAADAGPAQAGSAAPAEVPPLPLACGSGEAAVTQAKDGPNCVPLARMANGQFLRLEADPAPAVPDTGPSAFIPPPAKPGMLQPPPVAPETVALVPRPVTRACRAALRGRGSAAMQGPTGTGSNGAACASGRPCRAAAVPTGATGSASSGCALTAGANAGLGGERALAGPDPRRGNDPPQRCKVEHDLLLSERIGEEEAAAAPQAWPKRSFAAKAEAHPCAGGAAAAKGRRTPRVPLVPTTALHAPGEAPQAPGNDAAMPPAWHWGNRACRSARGEKLDARAAPPSGLHAGKGGGHPALAGPAACKWANLPDATSREAWAQAACLPPMPLAADGVTPKAKPERSGTSPLRLSRELAGLGLATAVGAGSAGGVAAARKRLRQTPQVDYSEKRRRVELPLRAHGGAASPGRAGTAHGAALPPMRTAARGQLGPLDVVEHDLATLVEALLATYPPPTPTPLGAKLLPAPPAHGLTAIVDRPGTVGKRKGGGAPPGEHGSAVGMAEPPRRLPDLGRALQVLHDSKHFVKDYAAVKAAAPNCPAPHAGESANVLCIVVWAPPTTPPPQSAPAKPRTAPTRALLQREGPASGAAQPSGGAPGGSAAGRGGGGSSSGGPPPEWVRVPQEATVAGLRRAAGMHYARLYRMFRDVKVEAVLGPDGLELAGRSWQKSAGAMLRLRCSGLDWDARWRHAGGYEDWTVRCGCGTRDDDGERMAACDVCGAWAHTRCAGLPDAAPPPAAFACTRCAARAAR